jgi:hypothetical protein
MSDHPVTATVNATSTVEAIPSEGGIFVGDSTFNAQSIVHTFANLPTDTVPIGEALSVGLDHPVEGAAYSSSNVVATAIKNAEDYPPFGVLTAVSLSPTLIEVRFNAELESEFAPLIDASNYSIPGLTVTGVSGLLDFSVELTTSTQSGISYTVTVAQAFSSEGQTLDLSLQSASFVGTAPSSTMTAIAVSPTKVRLVFGTTMSASGLSTVTNYSVQNLFDGPLTIISATPEQLLNPTSVALVLSSSTPLITQNTYQVTVTGITTAGSLPIVPSTVTFHWVDDWVQPFDRLGLPDSRPLVIPFSNFMPGGPLGIPDGQVFFSPALDYPVSNSTIQVEDISVCTYAFDTYEFPQTVDPPVLYTYAPSTASSTVLGPLFSLVRTSTVTLTNGSAVVTGSDFNSFVPGQTITFSGGTPTAYGTYIIASILDDMQLTLSSIYIGSSSAGALAMTDTLAKNTVLWAPFPRNFEVQIELSNSGEYQNDVVPLVNDTSCSLCIKQIWNPLYVSLLNDPQWVMFKSGGSKEAASSRIFGGSQINANARALTSVGADLNGDAGMRSGFGYDAEAAVTAESNILTGISGDAQVEADSSISAFSSLVHPASAEMASGSYVEARANQPFPTPPYVFICADLLNPSNLPGIASQILILKAQLMAGSSASAP